MPIHTTSDPADDLRLTSPDSSADASPPPSPIFQIKLVKHTMINTYPDITVLFFGDNNIKIERGFVKCGVCTFYRIIWSKIGLHIELFYVR